MTSKETDAMWRTRSEQPEALRLAYWMDDMPSVIPGNDSNEWHKAAAELRRLHAVNTELLKASKDAATSLETISRLAGKSTYKNDEGESFETYMRHHDEVRGYAKSRATVARAAIAKATGEQA